MEGAASTASLDGGCVHDGGVPVDEVLDTVEVARHDKTLEFGGSGHPGSERVGACTGLLAAAGIACTWRGSRISDGLELIRTALAPATGKPTLAIDPRCANLIDAFRNYHYSEPGHGEVDTPVKDGPDHCIDALRYFFVNRMRPKMPVSRIRY